MAPRARTHTRAHGTADGREVVREGRAARVKNVRQKCKSWRLRYGRGVRACVAEADLPSNPAKACSASSVACSSVLPSAADGLLPPGRLACPGCCRRREQQPVPPGCRRGPWRGSRRGRRGRWMCGSSFGAQTRSYWARDSTPRTPKVQQRVRSQLVLSQPIQQVVRHPQASKHCKVQVQHPASHPAATAGAASSAPAGCRERGCRREGRSMGGLAL